ARTAIAEGESAGGVGADVVALDGIAGRGDPDARVADARGAVAGDDVARGRRRTADGVVAAAQVDAIEAVAQGRVAGGVQADRVALERVAGAARDVNANIVVAGDNIAGPGRRAADGVV